MYLSRFRKFILTLSIATLLISPGTLFLLTQPAQAQVVVTDPVNLGERIAEFFKEMGLNLKKTMGAVAYKNALSVFLGKLAYDAAVWVASAGTGQETLVYTQPFGEYITDIADGAAGTYISSLADEAGFDLFDVCNPPDDLLKINISLGLQTSLLEPDEPTCKLSELGANWADTVKIDELEDVFKVSFDPAENHIGTFLTLKTNFGEWSAAEAEGEKYQRLSEGPVASQTGAISQYIQTPGDWINKTFIKTAHDANKPYETYTGEVLADTINIFTSTLFSKLVQRMQYGFIKEEGTELASIISGESVGTVTGAAAAKVTFASLNQPTFNPGGEIDSSYQLVEDGFIDQTLQMAISNHWRVQEYIDYLNENTEDGAAGFSFGLSSDEVGSPSGGITRQAIYQLKKYRIVPVGWQIAADFIYQNRNNADFSNVSLGDLADCADGDCLFNRCSSDNYSEFCKLVDPNWVFKAPSVYCEKESYGLKSVYDDFLDQDGNEFNQLEHVLNREEVCVDETTCINEDADGNCYDYGYCIRDERIYRFDGEECSENYSSCQSWTNQSTGEKVSYLTNTLNYGDCNNESAIGCQWYCQEQSEVTGEWACASPTEKYVLCDEDKATVIEDQYCYCSFTDTCEVDIYDSSCTITDDDGDTATCYLEETCSPQNENYIGANCVESGYTSCCECTLTDYAEVDVGSRLEDTVNYGLSCVLNDEDDDGTADVCSTDYSDYREDRYCQSLTCGSNEAAYEEDDDCEIIEGGYSCTNTEGDTCYLGTESIDPTTGDLEVVYLNSQTETCDEADDGCAEFIPARMTGSNLIYNSSFEINQNNAIGICAEEEEFCNTDADCGGGTGDCRGWEKSNSSMGVSIIEGSSVAAGTDYGNYFLSFDGTNSSDYIYNQIDYGNYPLANRSFSVSVQAYFETDCSTGLTITLGSTVNTYNALEITEVTSGVWTTYSTEEPVTFAEDETGTVLTLSIPNSCAVYIDAVVLEETDEASTYSDYASQNQIYLNNSRQECEPEEVGCKLYTPVTGRFTEAVPGVITNPYSDVCTDAAYDSEYQNPGCSQCPEEMVGCDYYQEQPINSTIPLGAETTSAVIGAIGATPGTQVRDDGLNYRTGKYCSNDQNTDCFDDTDCSGGGTCLDTISLIPSTAETCAAADVGCEEYTNMDTVEQGGEGIEYYSSLKQCVKTNDTQTATFYTWEGSDEAGYQLHSYLLKEADDGSPCTQLDLTVEDYNAPCNNDVIPANDCGPSGDDVYGEDEDCLLFYDADGNGYYRYYSETIAVTDDCVPLRNTLDGRVYYALPSASSSCSAEAVGCREYKGSADSDLKLLLDDDFASCSSGNWQSDVDTLDTPSESIYVDNCSLSLLSSQYYNLYETDDEGTAVSYLEEGLSYLVSFSAKGDDWLRISLDMDGDGTGDYYFTEDGSAETASAAKIGLDADEWNSFILGPLYLTESPDGDETLLIEFNGSEGYLDAITLQESESQYLIKGSADLCQYYEGCQKYKDEDDNYYYLKSFDHLCNEEVVGCEAVLNTTNTSYDSNFENPYPFTQHFNQTNEYNEDDLIIPYDQVELLVVDDDAACSEDVKGCQKLGQPDVNEQDDSIDGWEDVYLINDPDAYSDILCQYQHLRCQAYESDYDGVAYFKDPGDKTCYYDTVDETWYTTDADGDGAVEECPLFNDNDSPSQPMGSVCDGQDEEYAGKYCQEDDQCGEGRCVDTEDSSGWVGLCPEDESGCTAYSDPFTGEELFTNNSFEYDDMYNQDMEAYSEDDEPDNEPDYWMDLGDWDSDIIGIRKIIEYLGISYSGSLRCSIFEQSSDYAYDYTTSLKLTAGDGPCIILSQNSYEVDPNKTYTLSLKVLSNDISTQFSIGLLYFYYDSDSASYQLASLDIDGDDSVSDEEREVVNLTASGQSVDTADEWNTFYGLIGYGQSIEFPKNTVRVQPFIYVSEGGTLYADLFSFKQEESYYYIDYTIDGTEEGSVSGSTTDECVDGVDVDEGCVAFRDNTREEMTVYSDENFDDISDITVEACTYNPWEDSCSGAANSSDTNTIIKVRPDRVCDQWIACSSLSRIVSDTEGVADEIECQNLQICDELNKETGECSKWVREEERPNADDDLTYISDPNDAQAIDALDEIQDLTGYVRAGMIWPSMTSCSGGENDGQACDSDDDCGESGTCSDYLTIQGYYLYSEMAEYGDLEEEVISNGDFEDLTCTGSEAVLSKIDADSPCILDSQCKTSEIESYNDSDSCTSDGECIEEGKDSSLGYWCPNHYSDGAGSDEWAFSNWTAEGSADLEVVQYSDDETYTGDSRFSEEDNSDTASSSFTSDWNNVLKVEPQADEVGGVRFKGLDSDIIAGNEYTLSFKAKYLEAYNNQDNIIVSLVHSSNDGQTADDFIGDYITETASDAEGITNNSDIVFIVDITDGNLESEVQELEEAVSDLVENISRINDFRLALVTQVEGMATDRTTGASTSSCSTYIVQELTDDINEFTSALDSLAELSNEYSSFYTCNYDALYDVLYEETSMGGEDFQWRNNSNKYIFFITDSNEGAERNNVDVLPVGTTYNTCTYSDYQSITSALNAGLEAKFYVVSDLSEGVDQSAYKDIAYYVSGSTDYLYDVNNNGITEAVQSLGDIIASNSSGPLFQFNNIWQTYTFGPITITEKPSASEGETVTTDLVIAQSVDSSGASFIIDDVSLLPTLSVNEELDPIARSCRAYPEESSQSCSYQKDDGNYYRGWMGYCLEYDPEDRYNCLVWWPADTIKGEKVISTLKQDSGYNARAPVYHCLVAKGYASVGVCGETESREYYPTATTDSTTYWWDYNDFADDKGDRLICVDNNDCPSGQTCFSGADVSEIMYIGSKGFKKIGFYYLDDADFEISNHFAKGEYPQFWGNFESTGDPSKDIKALFSIDYDYKVITRRFIAPMVGKKYELPNSDGEIDEIKGNGGDYYNQATFLRYLANPLERNININEIEKIEFKPGYSGKLTDSTVEESNAFSPSNSSNQVTLELTNLENDWEYNGDKDLSDNITQCTKQATGDEGVDGLGCYWVRRYTDEADESIDIIYTYGFGAYAKKSDDIDKCEEKELLADECDAGSINAQVKQIVAGKEYNEDEGTVDNYDLTIEAERKAYQNPWNHLPGMENAALNYNGSDKTYVNSSNLMKIFNRTDSEVDSSDYFQVMANDDDANWFRAYNSTGYGGNLVSVYFDFDSEGYLKQIFTMTWYGAKKTAKKEKGIAPSYEEPMELIYYLREPCVVAVEGVDAEGDNYAWADRLTSGGYTLPGSMNIYQMYSELDDYPYAAMSPPDSADWTETPDEWDTIDDDNSLLTTQGNQPPMVWDAGNRANAGWPLVCIGNCSARICSNDFETHCVTDADCSDDGYCIGVGGYCEDSVSEEDGFCDEDSDCSGGGECNSWLSGQGLYDSDSDDDDLQDQLKTAAEVALYRYKHLFARPLDYYVYYQGKWQNNIINLDLSSEFIAMPACENVCGSNERCQVSDYIGWTNYSYDEDEYCGVRPEIENLTVNGYSEGDIQVSAPQKVTLSFESVVDAEQTPLDKICVDWGDGSGFNCQDWEAAPTTHYFDRWFYCDAVTSTGNYCSYEGETLADDIKCDEAYVGKCVYKPKIRLIDHWGWCSGNSGGSKYRNTNDSSVNCNTYDEFNGYILVSPST